MMPFRPFSRLFELYFGNRFLSPTPGEQFRAFQWVRRGGKERKVAASLRMFVFSLHSKKRAIHQVGFVCGGVGTFRRVWACPDTGQTILSPPSADFWMCR
ncbi:hypothetical protein CDAR_368131 [Caerostris darwini]|uniref:Uncharacterized protein n=1 Tax=Caerostris darwini TaxID=1538125 RepID=A0AAV4UIK1_9ARAC|nr:hypothetical protein CDAR_368131 [Caerostris darwini]